MIRISDLAPGAAWASRPVAAQRAETHNPASWFDGDAAGADVRISGDLGPSARGLGVDEHAGRVLALLCGERDAGA